MLSVRYVVIGEGLRLDEKEAMPPAARLHRGSGRSPIMFTHITDPAFLAQATVLLAAAAGFLSSVERLAEAIKRLARRFGLGRKR
ncbi:hypothetical protein Mrad2831_6537 (plasmid) [Methylobacterium radiotolerans JCM 2831]|uniref:Uncharacterized protein n=1 Tax=Methylobacterium radiotolerans (strain ATCC 27329 / DSM 1819 / JCM 2831 / NBRC 15690 / NCIMB 10815 / 0-1) TaxID=426355 RepID=B1MAC4_METRJ|nr:hypothetical protein Mrad2831_6537 [Methylobacterium radiotolerans JCM 2831]GEN01718.1 hypothetical protein MRA01_62570 [Methylobacterium radiotolerans]